MPHQSFSSHADFAKETIDKGVSPAYFYALPFLSFLVVTLGLLKIMFYLRVSKGTGQLVLMVTQSIFEVRTFLIFLFIWIFYFAMTFNVLGVTFDEGGDTPYDDYDDDHGDYRLIDPSINLIFQSIRNSIGDVAPPHYLFWKIRYANNDKVIALIAINLIWILWLVQIAVMVVIMLNFLIAIVSQAYENVISK